MVLRTYARLRAITVNFLICENLYLENDVCAKCRNIGILHFGIFYVDSVPAARPARPGIGPRPARPGRPGARPARGARLGRPGWFEHHQEMAENLILPIVGRLKMPSNRNSELRNLNFR